LAEYDDVGLDVEILQRPELAGAVEAHLDFVIDQQDFAGLEHFLELLEITRRRNDVTAGALDRLDIEGGIFADAHLGVPHAVILAIEQAGELIDAIQAAIVALLAIRAAEAIRKRHELRAVAEMPVAA